MIAILLHSSGTVLLIISHHLTQILYICQKKETLLGSEQLDSLCNLGKYYIYTCRFNMQNPSIHSFKQRVVMYKNVEKYAAKINKKEDQFLKKWTSTDE